MKLWLDTDIGDDIDDALTLEAILKNQDIELLGISTVFKNAPLRAMLAKKMVNIAGKTVPVYAGQSTPLHGLRRINHGEIYNQYGKELEPVDPKYEKQSQKNEAGLALLQALKEHPDAIVLAIGPLTNLGVAVSLDKEGVLSQHPIYFMGGDYKRHISEWNLLCDVEAASRLFQSNLNLHAIGLDQTETTRMSADEEDKMKEAGSAPLDDYRRILVDRFKHSTHWEITPHDCLAYYALLHHHQLNWKTAKAEIEIEGNDAFLRLSVGHSLAYLDSYDRGAFISWLIASLS